MKDEIQINIEKSLKIEKEEFSKTNFDYRKK